MNILLVEDDFNMGELVKDALEENNFTVTLCRDGKEGLRAFIKGSFNIVILDVMMPKIDGFSLAEKIRKLNHDIPFMFMTALTETDNKLRGFELGADDYLAKPFSVKELVMRIHVIARRIHGSMVADSENSQFQLGKMRFDYAKRDLEYDGTLVKVSSKESELLKLFCLNPNKIVRRDFLLRHVWGGDDYFSSKSMDVYISRLRKLLKPAPEIQIINIHGAGFRFLVPALQGPGDIGSPEGAGPTTS
ncbi:MAG: response regulator transcription factor [Bacteroidetes bacterium]|nr:response regulator transcription factor [Bacteroidota bacterium]